ncbi:hypothetical protein ACOMHN_046296 [Nucella lapillus]
MSPPSALCQSLHLDPSSARSSQCSVSVSLSGPVVCQVLPVLCVSLSIWTRRLPGPLSALCQFLHLDPSSARSSRCSVSVSPSGPVVCQVLPVLCVSFSIWTRRLPGPPGALCQSLHLDPSSARSSQCSVSVSPSGPVVCQVLPVLCVSLSIWTRGLPGLPSALCQSLHLDPSSARSSQCSVSVSPSGPVVCQVLPVLCVSLSIWSNRLPGPPSALCQYLHLEQSSARSSQCSVSVSPSGAIVCQVLPVLCVSLSIWSDRLPGPPSALCQSPSGAIVCQVNPVLCVSLYIWSNRLPGPPSALCQSLHLEQSSARSSQCSVSVSPSGAIVCQVLPVLCVSLSIWSDRLPGPPSALCQSLHLE